MYAFIFAVLSKSVENAEETLKDMRRIMDDGLKGEKG